MTDYDALMIRLETPDAFAALVASVPPNGYRRACAKARRFYAQQRMSDLLRLGGLAHVTPRPRRILVTTARLGA